MRNSGLLLIVLGVAAAMFPQAPPLALRRLRWIWLWIVSCLPQRPPKDEEIQVFTAENLGRSRRRRWETDADVVEQFRNCTHFLPRHPIYGEFAEI